MYQNEGTLQRGAPPNVSRTLAPKNSEKYIFLAPVTIVEMFASHVPRRIQILGTGGGLGGYYQNVFLSFSTNVQ